MVKSLNELSFSKEFFCDEVREGFYVSETMKHYWAAEIKVLSEIDKICRRHDCKWFADSGTLLGIVRHKGFIPWDDDIDITMLRDDLEKFLTFAREELPDGYVILSTEDVAEYENPFCRITNSNVIDKRMNFLENNFGCPFIAGVDIFPLDNIYMDSEKEKNREERARYVFFTYKGVLEKKYNDDVLQNRIERIEQENNVIIDSINIKKSLLDLFVNISKECKDERTKEVAVMYRWVSEGIGKFLRAYYDEWEDMPFETTLLRTPLKYHEILSLYYGDYMTVVKGTAIHDYPIYKSQEDLFREKFNMNPTRYNFEKEKFKPNLNRKTMMQEQLELIELMHHIHEKIRIIKSENDTNFLISYLQACQKAAIAIGTSLENKFGESGETILFLEEYCEKIYEVCEKNNNIDISLDELLIKIEKSLVGLYENCKKEVLFLLCKFEWWETISGLFRKMSQNTNYNITVISIPYYYHMNQRIIENQKSDFEEFSKIPELQGKLINYEENYLKKHFDKIIIQFPFDGYSGTIGIPESLYSENLKKHTDQLIYVPCLKPECPESENDVANKAMKDLIEQPAVFYSDKVVTGSEALRSYYIDTLVEMTDESNREYWNEKICVSL